MHTSGEFRWHTDANADAVAAINLAAGHSRSGSWQFSPSLHAGTTSDSAFACMILHVFRTHARSHSVGYIFTEISYTAEHKRFVFSGVFHGRMQRQIAGACLCINTNAVLGRLERAGDIDAPPSTAAAAAGSTTAAHGEDSGGECQAASKPGCDGLAEVQEL